MVKLPTAKNKVAKQSFRREFELGMSKLIYKEYFDGAKTWLDERIPIEAKPKAKGKAKP